MTETLQIADLNFEVRRGPRRKTLGLTVDRAGELEGRRSRIAFKTGNIIHADLRII